MFLHGAQRVDGGVRVITAKRTLQRVHPGLQGGDLGLQAADVIQEGGRSCGTVLPDEGGQTGELLLALADPAGQGVASAETRTQIQGWLTTAPADGDRSIWLERRDSNSRPPLYKNGTLTG